MAISTQYRVTKLWASPEPVNGFDGVVLNVFLDVVATDTTSGAQSTHSAVANINPPEEGATAFVAYGDLTEAQLIDWVKTQYGEGATEEWERQAAAGLQAAPAATSLPWQ